MRLIQTLATATWLAVTTPLLALAADATATAAATPAASAAQVAQRASLAGAPLDAADLSAWLDGRVPYALKSGDIAGAVVVVVKDGKVLLRKGYGYADVGAKVPMDPDRTLIRPGSTSKLVTWTAVMQLVQQGKLDLNRDVNDYLDFKVPEPFGKPITMLDLMNHRAGFEEGLKDLLAYDPVRAPSNEQYLKAHPRPMLFAPGTVPAYSNYGAALAGYIVQRLSGQSFEQYVDAHIFKPLGMADSTFEQPLPKRFEAAMAKGYRTAGGEPSPFELVVTGPAGSMSATASDMAHFMLAHLQQGSLDGHQMLDPGTTALMHSPSESSLPGFDVMAHGFFSMARNGQAVIGHGGDTIVFHSEMNLLPQQGVGIFFSFNSRGKDNAVYVARQELFDGFMDRYFPDTTPAGAATPTLATAPADAQRIAGRYQTSRRVEHGFLSALYLMSQSVITALPDGTINAPAGPGGTSTVFREVAPQLWQKVGGRQQLALRDLDGVKTVVDSENPITVLQEASFVRSAPLSLTVLSFSVAILLCTLLAWPLGAVLRRADRASSPTSPEVRRLRLVQRIAGVVQAAYLAAWLMLIMPVLNTEVALYSTAIDGVVRTLQLCGLLAVAAAVAGAWAAWRMSRSDATRLSKAWSVVVALALLGVVWIAWTGQLLSWNLNY